MSDEYGAPEGAHFRYVNLLRAQAGLPILIGGQGRDADELEREVEPYLAAPALAHRHRRPLGVAARAAAITLVLVLALAGAAHLASIAEAARP